MRLGFFVAAFLFIQSVLAETVPAKTESHFSPEQVKEIEMLVVKTLGKNPDLVAKTLHIYMQKEEAKAKKAEAIARVKMQKKLNEDKTRLRLLNAKTALCEGNPDAKRKLVIFYDNNCGHCRQLDLKIQKLQEANPQAVLILRRPYPLRGEDSNKISAPVVAVAQIDANKFIELNGMVLKAEDFVSEKDIEKFTESLGLSWKDVLNSASSLEVQHIIEENYQLGQDIGLDGTPMVILYDEEGNCHLINDIEKDIEPVFSGV